ncbi:MAG: phosphopantetheine-binding protein [Pseudomonadota bacterium]|nr:phosphopantetheine-binding protein [Pseudomonadota bacterium]MDP1906012.1 phosphopantetheine-binding protein [Pseudomonadota bacterium]MDP2352483.1 phosphopantetheine-binding protein [Pseudomonadota bacterium]
MNLDRDAIKAAVRAKVIELAKNLGMDASDIGDDDLIPATGYVDSAAILELVVWYEDAYQMPLKQEEINIDNLGSINSMADFVIKRKG